MKKRRTKRYAALLEAVFFNQTARGVVGKSDKAFDENVETVFHRHRTAGVLAWLNVVALSIRADTCRNYRRNFVVGELLKQTGRSEKDVKLFHFRTQTNTEVDVVMKTNGGEVVGIEIKSSASVAAAAFKGLRTLE